MPTELAELAGQLELQLSPDGTPANPLVVLRLDDWRDAPPGLVKRAAALVAGALPVTAGVLTGPPALSLEPLITAATLTLASRAAAGESVREAVAVADVPGRRDLGGALSRLRPVVPVEDVPGGPDLDGALGRLRAAVERSPRKPFARTFGERSNCAHGKIAPTSGLVSAHCRSQRASAGAFQLAKASGVQWQKH